MNLTVVISALGSAQPCAATMPVLGAFSVETAMSMLAVSLVVLPLVFGLAYLCYLLFSIPMRRHEQTRLILGLLEVGIEGGQSVEHTLGSLSRRPDRALDKRLRRLGRCIAKGATLDDALRRVPHALPRQIAAMLRAGNEAGDPRKVLPACRQFLRDGVAKVWMAHHYLVLLAFVTVPGWLAVAGAIGVFVLPKLRQIYVDMLEGAPLPALTEAVFENYFVFVVIQTLILAVLWGGVLLYVGGPRVTGMLTRLIPLPWDHLETLLPWRRKRMQRDFSSVLAALLDAGVTEARAVSAAADCTANGVFRQAAARAVEDLRSGVALPEALNRLDERGELRWRLANAAHGRGGFFAALTGWHEALDAKAFQEEQTAAQVVTSGLVCVNGVMVGVLAVAIFLILTNLIDTATLW